MQSLQRREHALLGARVISGSSEHRCGGLCPAGQQLGIVGDLAFEQLAHHSERKRAVKLGSPRAQNAQAVRIAKLAGGAEKLCLTDAGLALDDQQRTLTVAYPREEGGYQPQLAFTLQKAGVAA